MAFHYRKLLPDPEESVPAPVSLPSPLSVYCQPSCVAAPVIYGSCISICLDVCPDNCTQPFQFPPPPPPVSNKSQNPSLLLIASLAVLALAFFVFTCYTIYKFYTIWTKSRRRRLSRRIEQDAPGPGPDDDDDDDDEYGPVVDHPIWYIRTVGLQPSAINAITIVKYKIGDGLVEGTDCAVCLSEFQDDETLRLLPKCSHAFHIPCIDTWLASHTNCPMCRAPIVTTATGPLIAQDPPPHHSGRAEEAGVSEIEDDGASRSQSGVELNGIGEGGDFKIDAGELEGAQLQGVRRSVSMDSVSASMIRAAVANALNSNDSEKQLVKAKDEQVGRRSVGVNDHSLLRLVISPSIQTGVGASSSMKRSASCSARVFLSRHNSTSRS